MGGRRALTGELSRATAELLTASLEGGTGLTAITVPANAQPDIKTLSADSSVVDAAKRRADGGPAWRASVRAWPDR